MFCSLCNSWDPCGKTGCWIEPKIGYEYEKARQAGFLRDGEGNSLRTNVLMRVHAPVHADPKVSTLTVHAVHVEPDDEIEDTEARRRAYKAKKEREYRKRRRGNATER